MFFFFVSNAVYLCKAAVGSVDDGMQICSIRAKSVYGQAPDLVQKRVLLERVLVATVALVVVVSKKRRRSSATQFLAQRNRFGCMLLVASPTVSWFSPAYACKNC